MALRGTLTHWKTRMLAQKLAIEPWAALGLLEALWHATAELAPSGNIGRLPNQAIGMEMFYAGNADQLIAALVHSGHLDESLEHRLVVHDWSQHSDYNTRRKVARRGESMADGSTPRLGMTRHESTPVPEPEPEPEPEVSLAPSAPAHESLSPAVGSLPLVSGEEWSYSQEQLDAWTEAYPAVNVQRALLGIREWLSANPRKRNTRAGMPRFVVQWLARDQDQGGSRFEPSGVRRHVQAAPVFENALAAMRREQSAEVRQ